MKTHDAARLLEQLADLGAVEVQGLAIAEDRRASQRQRAAIWIERHARIPGGGDDAAPIWIVAVHRAFHQRRIGDGARHLPRGGVACCAFHRHYDDLRRPFAVRGNLIRQGLADFIERARERGDLFR